MDARGCVKEIGKGGVPVANRVVEWVKDVVLFVLVLAMLAQSAHILVLDQRYPGNDGALSTLRMLWRDLNAAGAAGGDWQEGVSGRELWPASVVLLSAEGEGYLPFRTENEAAQIAEVLSLVVQMLRQGQPFFSDKHFEDMLQQDGLLVDLGRALPVDMVLALLGESGDLKRQVRYLLLTETEDGIQLSMDGDQMLCYAIKGDQIRQSYLGCANRIASSPSLLPIGIVGRDGMETSIKMGTLYAKDNTDMLVATGTNALFEPDGSVSTTLLQTALPAFSYNISTPRRDVEADGTLVYVENYSSIRLAPDGVLAYRASEARHGLPLSRFLSSGDRENYRARDVILGAYALLDSIHPEFGDLPGAGLRYTGASFSREEGKLYLYFDYVLGGMTVICKGYDHAATLCYENGYFSSVTLLLRNYTLQESCHLADFERQWRMAEIQTGVAPGTAELCYEDNLDGTPMVATYRFGIAKQEEAPAK